jgi:hypothetical protein
MRKFIPFALAATFALGACGTVGGDSTEYNKGDASSAITAAEHEAKRAKAKNYEWRDTGKMIKKAKAAMKDGDFGTAVKLANKAKHQSTNALAQYEQQKSAGPNM